MKWVESPGLSGGFVWVGAPGRSQQPAVAFAIVQKRLKERLLDKGFFLSLIIFRDRGRCYWYSCGIWNTFEKQEPKNKHNEYCMWGNGNRIHNQTLVWFLSCRHTLLTQQLWMKWKPQILGGTSMFQCNVQFLSVITSNTLRFLVSDSQKCGKLRPPLVKNWELI